MTNYQLEPTLSADEFVDVLVRSTLAERRPTHDLQCIDKMLRNADIIVTARVDGLLVGISRAISALPTARICRIWRSMRGSSVRVSVSN
jgi:hypothetical protein